MADTPERPEGCTDEMLRFLDELRSTGQVNMFGAEQPLREMYPELSREAARATVTYWMRTFGQRHPKKGD